MHKKLEKILGSEEVKVGPIQRLHFDLPKSTLGITKVGFPRLKTTKATKLGCSFWEVPV